MTAEQQPAMDQEALWNGHAGQVWTEDQAFLDRLLRPIETRLAGGDYKPGAEVLDVGCGTGATSLAIARAVGPGGGRCTGIDISAPMIALARARAEAEGLDARFIRADATSHDFEPGRFDAIVSRFGVMFFEDPVRAFANLRRAAKAGAALDAYTWRSPAENDFMTAAERAAAPLLPEPPPRRPDAPGQFAFADPGRVEAILSESGWGGIAITGYDFDCAFPVSALEGYFTRMGPLGVFLGSADAETRARIIAAVRPAFDGFVRGEEVRFTAACWRVTARAV